MKRVFLLCVGMFVGTLATAQTVHFDVKNKECSFANDSLYVQMSLSGSIDNLSSKEAVILTPYISSSANSVDLPYMQYNGKQKYILYTRNKNLRGRSKSNDVEYLSVVSSNGEINVDYKVAVAKEDWMDGAELQIRCEKIDADSQRDEISNVYVQEIESSMPKLMFASNTTSSASEPVSTDLDQTISNRIKSVTGKRYAYRGSYIAPESDATDERNQRDLNFTLEETQVMVNINPNILSLKELYTVAMSYQNDREKFYNIISTCVKLYPTHPIANLNAASMSIELGDLAAVSRYLQIAPYDSLAYKNCRGVYELMSGNIYEGIRLLKSAKAEGSEEAGYNLDIFFKSNK